MSGEVREWKQGVGKRVQPDGSYRMVIRWRDRDGRQSTETLPAGYARKTAMIARAERIREASRGVAPGTMTLDEFLPVWDASIERLRPNTRYGYRSLVKLHVQPAFGRRRLREIRPSLVQEWVDRGRGAELSPAMQRKVIGCLSTILKAAALRDLAEASPPLLELVAIRPTPKHAARALSMDELDTLLTHLDAWYRPDVEWLAVTGLRRGEHAALLAADIDLPARTASVHRIQNRYGHVEEATKAGEFRARQIDLFDRACQAVQRKRELRLERGIRAELFFTTPSGAAISWQNFHRRHWKPATVAAGLEGLTPHELRHTAASLMIAAGLELAYVSQQLGHDDITTTTRIYAHFLESRRPLMVDRFDQAYTTTEGAR